MNNKFLYEPKYGIVKSFDDITQEMADSAEDHMYVANKIAGGPFNQENWRFVGLIDLTFKFAFHSIHIIMYPLLVLKKTGLLIVNLL